MPLQHHFIVVVEDGKIFIDHETSINFDGGSVWDTETETWQDPYDHYKQNETAMELLWDKINREDN